jgi:hypothetical protein
VGSPGSFKPRRAAKDKADRWRRPCAAHGYGMDKRAFFAQTSPAVQQQLVNSGE